MMKNLLYRKISGIAAFVLCLAAGRAGALSFSSVSTLATLTYSPDNTVQTTGNVKIKCGGTIGDFCVTFTQTALTPAPAAPAEGLSYGFYQPAASPTYALSLDGSPASASEVLIGNFPPGSKSNATVTLGYAAIVSPLTLPPPGSYTATIRVKLYASGWPISGSPVATRNLTFRVTVNSHFDVSVVPSGSSFSLGSTSTAISFGTIREGDFQSADVLVRANVSYSLSLTSATGSALSTPIDAASLIGYALTANDAPVTLSAGMASPVDPGAAATYSVPMRYVLVVTIMPFADFPTEGSYSDSLTVTLAAP